MKDRLCLLPMRSHIIKCSVHRIVRVQKLTSYLLVIGGFVLCRKKLFSSVHYFVHLNLAISLLLGYVVFMFGIELGTASKVIN